MRQHRHVQKVRHRDADGVTRDGVVEHDYEHSGPMEMDAREAAYRRQNGFRPLTARQTRQLARQAFRCMHAQARRYVSGGDS